MVRRPPEPQEVPRLRPEPLADALAHAVAKSIRDAHVDALAEHERTQPYCDAATHVLAGAYPDPDAIWRTYR